MSDHPVGGVRHHSVVPSVQAALLTIALSIVMGLAAQTGVLVPVVATVFVAQVMIATAPAPADDHGRALPMPHLVPTLVGSVVAAAIAYHPLLLLGAATRASLDGLQVGVFAGVVIGGAAGLIAAIVAQIARRDGRRSLVRSLSAASSLTLFAALASGWIGAARASTGPDIVVVSCIAMVAGLLVWMAPGPRLLVVPLAVLVGAGAAVGASYIPDIAVPIPFAATAGLGVAGVATLGLAVGTAWTHGRHHLATAWGLPAALSFALTGPVVFVAGDFLSALPR